MRRVIMAEIINTLNHFVKVQPEGLRLDIQMKS